MYKLKTAKIQLSSEAILHQCVRGSDRSSHSHIYDIWISLFDYINKIMVVKGQSQCDKTYFVA